MKYNLIMDCSECNELNVTKERVIEYAENRLKCNEEERIDWDFNTYNMNLKEAILVIESFGETVEDVKNITRRWAIVQDNNGTQTLEDYDTLAQTKQAFKLLKERGYHIAKNDDSNIRMYFDKGTKFFMDCEVWDIHKNIHLRFESVEHTVFTL